MAQFLRLRTQHRYREDSGDSITSCVNLALDYGPAGCQWASDRQRQGFLSSTNLRGRWAHKSRTNKVLTCKLLLRVDIIPKCLALCQRLLNGCDAGSKRRIARHYDPHGLGRLPVFRNELESPTAEAHFCRIRIGRGTDHNKHRIPSLDSIPRSEGGGSDGRAVDFGVAGITQVLHLRSASRQRDSEMEPRHRSIVGQRDHGRIRAAGPYGCCRVSGDSASRFRAFYCLKVPGHIANVEALEAALGTQSHGPPRTFSLSAATAPRRNPVLGGCSESNAPGSTRHRRPFESPHHVQAA